VNWYRTRKINYEDELAIKEVEIPIPFLFISAKQDAALPPKMAEGMQRNIPQLTRRETDASHWVLMEKPDEVNRFLSDWLATVVDGSDKFTPKSPL